MKDDRFLSSGECVSRLVENYREHKNLFIAFDFDNTVYDYHGVGDTFTKIEEILRHVKKMNMTLILFTANEGHRLDFIKQYCKERGYEPDYVNENPITKTTKPYYNILLDDRAGLKDAYQTLLLTLNTIEDEQFTY